MSKYLLSAALLLGGAFLGSVQGKEPLKRPVVEVTLCLDVSSSMDGLVASAKQKLWDIVNDLARTKPTPVMRVAVYSYGNNAYDAKTGWVRREIELTSDLDKVSEKLFALQATKLSNSEEYVARVARDAVEKLDWTADAKALKVVFVCGNEPVNQDKELKLEAVSEAAVRKGIIINTIYCGSPAHADAPGWKEFAVRSEGRFASIDQNRGVVSIAAPQDKELAELSAKINATFCFAGRNAKGLAENQKRQDQNAQQLGGAAAAARAISKGGELYGFGGHDLVECLRKDAKFDVKKIPVEELSDELKKMSPEAREKHVRELLAQREKLQAQIAELAKKRDAYIESERKKAPAAADRAFDEAVRGALREQAKKKGIDVPK